MLKRFKKPAKPVPLPEPEVKALLISALTPGPTGPMSILISLEYIDRPPHPFIGNRKLIALLQHLHDQGWNVVEQK